MYIKDGTRCVFYHILIFVNQILMFVANDINYHIPVNTVCAGDPITPATIIINPVSF